MIVRNLDLNAYHTLRLISRNGRDPSIEIRLYVLSNLVTFFTYRVQVDLSCVLILPNKSVTTRY